MGTNQDGSEAMEVQCKKSEGCVPAEACSQGGDERLGRQAGRVYAGGAPRGLEGRTYENTPGACRLAQGRHRAAWSKHGASERSTLGYCTRKRIRG